jgi:hypothetical protein
MESKQGAEQHGIKKELIRMESRQGAKQHGIETTFLCSMYMGILVPSLLG